LGLMSLSRRSPSTSSVGIGHRRSPGRSFFTTTLRESLPSICVWFPTLTFERLSYLVRDNDAAYGQVFRNRLRAMGIRDRPIFPRSPWQNGIAERLIGTLRRECLDQIIVIGEAHLQVGTDPQAKASVICRASHTAVGCRVTSNHSSCRRPWPRTRKAFDPNAMSTGRFCCDAVNSSRSKIVLDFRQGGSRPGE
jgi:Integrase core domain